MRSWLVIACLGISVAFGYEIPADVLVPQLSEKQQPWFTGPLITPSGNNIPKGELNFQPYVFATCSDSVYNEDWKKVASSASAWNINILPILQLGLTSWLDFTMTPSWSFTLSNGSKSFNFGDFYAAFGLQIHRQTEGNWLPSIRLVLGEIFPTGRFENLDPEQFGTDSAGSGSYVSRAMLILSRMIHLGGIHWTHLRFAFAYSFPSKVRVHGYSPYGGAFDTNGWIYPGQGAQILFGCEFNLTQRWVFANDFVAYFNKSVHFKGNPGFNEITGLPANLNQGSAAQFSMAPALEYNWSVNLGIVSGVWFTVAGRNAEVFTSWVTALNYFY